MWASFRLEHPNKLLHAIFEKLYDNDIVSEDGFQVATTEQMMRHTPYFNDDKKVIPVSQNHGENSYGNSWQPYCKVNS